MEFDSKNLRNVLGFFTTGVAIITTQDSEGKSVGVTVNSFSSVSLSPPLILFSMATTSNCTSTFEACKVFTVNVLGTRQKDLALMFAKPSSADWDSVAIAQGDNGCPKIEGSIAHLECEMFNIVPGGDHLIFIGKVTGIRSEEHDAPLIYYRGAFKELELTTAAAA